MDIGSDQYTIRQLFSQSPVFRTPRYQRNYAWRSDEVHALLRDLELCLKARQRGATRPHFLGSLVTVQARAGGRARHNCQVIDGQQRLATFVMLATQLRQTMEGEARRLREMGAEDSAQYLSEKAALIKSKYEWHSDETGHRITLVPRLELSVADQPFFKAMLAGEPLQPERASHHRLADAFSSIGEMLSSLLQNAEDVVEARVAALAHVDDVLSEDWTVILLDTDDRATAYMLFQVLNDRGMGLTEGELLRATTLERLETKSTLEQLELAELAWHDILSASPERVDHAFRSIYASYRGEGAGKTTLFDDLQEQIFPMVLTDPFEHQQAEELIRALEGLRGDMLRAASLQRGEWPNESPTAVAWDRERLRLLMLELKQSRCLPILITASLLSDRRFRQVLSLLELFLFRYAVIAGGPTIPEEEVLLRHAVAIRADPANYDVRTLSADLRQLIAASAPDDVFAARLSELQYSRSAGNQVIKYFLMTLEHYAAWYDGGAVGVAECRDKSRILDFATSTLEHIYPERAQVRDPRLEPLLDTLGNLTVLSAGENDDAGNRQYTEKRPIFARSTNQLNRWIATADDWTPETVKAYQDHLIAMALKVFAL